MITMRRNVTPELLDELAADDPRACRSRRDLRRIHRVMRSVSILQKSIVRIRLPATPWRVLELGAGDGTLLLRLGRAMRPKWPEVDVTLLDRLDLVTAATRAGYSRLGWKVTVLCDDVLSWAQREDAARYELGISNLFLHHLDHLQLPVVLAAVANRVQAFVACEPRRSFSARVASRLVALLGANEVTRSDASKSVAAGFAGQELTTIWAGARGAWRTEEVFAWPFTHCFAASLASGEGAVGRHAN